MRLRGIAVVLAALALGACDAGRLTEAASDLARPRAEPGPRTNVDGSDYWTEEEYEAAGGPNATEFEPGCCTTGNFSSDMRSFTGRGAVRMRMLTDVSLTLSVQVLLNSNGTPLNSGNDSYSYNGVVPLFETRDFVATVSTLNHKCGITGKARLSGNGGVRVITTKDGALMTIWQRNIDMPAPDRTADSCRVVDECSSQIYYANGSCNESEEPAEGGEAGGGGGGGGGGDSGGGDSGEHCTLWMVTIYWARESGEVVEIIDQYTFWDCY